MTQPLLEFQNLRITFGDRVAVDSIDLTIEKGQTLAMVGESGSGKSVTALATLGLLPGTATIEGKIISNGENILKMTPRRLQKLRGKNIAMVFQEPMTSLNPVFTIGEQIMETMISHESISSREAKHRTCASLEEVGISPERFTAYPHEFSGGMRQRVMIAIAIACKPSLFIADEPTTALDASTSRQVIDLLRELQQTREMAMMFITHDLCLVPEVAETICVLRSGKIVESGDTYRILQTPQEEYTASLIACIPSLQTKQHRLTTIDGRC